MSEEPNSPSAGEEDDRQGRLRPSGGYRTLRDFHVATLIYDATVAFCGRFVDPRSRTVDQMVQAARSGRQNIAEGSRAAAASSQVELRLVNTARASLEELLLDYEDFLRHHHLRAWDKDEPEARAVRKLGRERRVENPTDRIDPSDPPDAADRRHWELYAAWLEHKDPEIVANTLICLIHQTNYLLDQQIAALEREFIQEGGYSKQLAAARIAERERARRAETEQEAKPQVAPCPLCGRVMVLRTARKGRHAGSQFWGCSGYPECKGTRALDGGSG
jgi:restriction system protein